MCAACRSSDKIVTKPREILGLGCEVLDPILHAHGFSFEYGGEGPSSGGPYAFGSYVNSDRRIEIHFRHSLGLVTYHFGEASLDHEAYMRALLGDAGGNKYPGFSDNPLDAFGDLADDLQSFAGAFLNNDAEGFMRCVAKAEELQKTSGFARLP
jgi:hypothetical protein